MYYIIHLQHITISKNQTIVHVYILSKTFGHQGKKKVYILTSPLLCRHHLQATWKDRQRWKWTIDSWRTYSRYHSCVNRWGKNNENNKWRQQKIVCVCVRSVPFFGEKNVPDSLCVCLCPVDWFGKRDYIYIYYSIFNACSVGIRGTMEWSAWFLERHSAWLMAAEVLSRLECIVTLAYLMHKICMNCDHLSAIHTIVWDWSACSLTS